MVAYLFLYPLTNPYTLLSMARLPEGGMLLAGISFLQNYYYYSRHYHLHYYLDIIISNYHHRQNLLYMSNRWDNSLNHSCLTS